MASLNTLRTKFGWILSIIIGVALLAFIVTLDDSWLGGGRDPKIGSIDGDKIKYSEYSETLHGIESQYNPQTDEQRDQIADMAWNTLITKHVYVPGFEKMGLRVTETERTGIISGEYVSPSMAMYFTNPETGIYDVQSLQSFLLQARDVPQMQEAWNSLVEGALQERVSMKYGSLVNAAAYANRLEVDRGLALAHKAFNGVWVGKRYADVPDSLFTVTDAEIESYYDSHKARYKQLPSRMISYVRFEVKPSAEDQVAAGKWANETAAALAAGDEEKATLLADSLRALPVEVSAATRRQIHNQASAFALNAKGSVELFDASATASNLTLREAKLTQGEREVQGLAGSREFARWAYNAKVGATSQAIQVDNDYVVATVTAIDNNAYAPMAQVSDVIRRAVIKEKKYAQFAEQMQGKTLEQIAAATDREPVAFEMVRYTTAFIPNLGMEPRMAGAIAATTKTDVLSQPVQGENGAYAFVVTEIVDTNSSMLVTPPAAEQMQQEGAIRNEIQQQLPKALEQLSNVVDLRGKYF